MTKPEQIISNTIQNVFRRQANALSEEARLIAASNILGALISCQIAPGQFSSDTINSLCNHALRALANLENSLAPQKTAANL